MYIITYSPRAKEGLAKLKKSEPAAFKKATKLLNEIALHPYTGTGHPEPEPKPDGIVQLRRIAPLPHAASLLNRWRFAELRELFEEFAHFGVY